MSDKMSTSKLPLALLVLRISLALFLLPWVIEKFTKPQQTVDIFSHFYHIKMPIEGAYVVGAIWALLLLAFVTGFKKRISYGLVMLFHGAGTIFTIPKLLPFLETYNHLFVAAIPTLGAMIALYLMRENDRLFAIGK